MNLRDLKYLLALADHKHFGRAAAACFVSQPTLSTQIRKLEEELGVVLVERAPRKVMITAAGQDVVQRARRIVVLTDSSKFGKVSLHRIARLEEIHTIITDSGISAEYREGLQRLGIAVIVVDPMP